MSWTDERVELLKKLWTDGLSASQIASELGGVTRNAVIGKVHRLGLVGRAKSPSVSQPRPRKVATPARPAANSAQQHIPVHQHVPVHQHRPAPAQPMSHGATALAMQPMEMAMVRVEATPMQDVVVPMSRRVQIMELREAMCKWPIGDPMMADFVFCGADCSFGTSYCTFHSTIAYQPPSERRRSR
ncbi:MAG: GcrA family cell cycle regulator [Beijerinckiaceae bacterium]